MQKKMFVIVFVLFVSFGSAMADYWIWNPQPADDVNWSDGGNWYLGDGNEPSVTKPAQVQIGSLPGPVITKDAFAVNLYMSTGAVYETSSLTIDPNGSLTVLGITASHWFNTNSLIQVNGGSLTVTNPGSAINLGSNAANGAIAVLDVNGGDVNSIPKIYVGYGAGTTGRLIIDNGGAFTTHGVLYGGYYGHGEITVSNGTLIADQYVYLGAAAPGQPAYCTLTINDGGVVTSPALYVNPNGGVIDIHYGGKAYVTDVTQLAELQSYVGTRLIANGGLEGQISISPWDGTKYTIVVPRSSDIYPDGEIDFKDLKVMADQWLGCTFVEGAGCEDTGSGHTIMKVPAGGITVNGDLSDWPSGSEWIPLDQRYAGSGTLDVVNPRFSVRWDDASDKIYLAVIVDDSDHHFFDTMPVDYQGDMIEIYSSGGASNGSNWGLFQSNAYDVAQQYFVGQRLSDSGRWATWPDGTSIDTSAGFESAVVVNGSVITYEIGIKQFDYYGYLAGGTTEVTPLASGVVVGFDVLVDTLQNGPLYNVLSENLMPSKYTYAANFQRYTLAEEGGCGGWGYLGADINSDCRVNLKDLATFASDWLK